MADAPNIHPLGDNAVTIDLGNEISLDLNDRAIALAERLDRDPFPGFIESAPAYSSVTVFYDPLVVHRRMPEYPSAYLAVKTSVEMRLDQAADRKQRQQQVVEIPCSFDDDAAMDIDLICEFSRLDPTAVIDLFTSRVYRVFMLGFLPGFTYMGEVDERIAAPRRPSPRKRVPRGSVGIAGKQTGIYPLESPGGWQIVGRTDVELFSASSDPPCLLKPGDSVRFVPS